VNEKSNNGQLFEVEIETNWTLELQNKRLVKKKQQRSQTFFF